MTTWTSRSLLLTVFWALSVFLLASHAAASASSRHASWQAIARGGGSSPIELNPSYQPKHTNVNFPPPAGDMHMNNNHNHNQPFMPHQFHVETSTHTPSLFPDQPQQSRGPITDFQSLRDSIQQYILRLYQNSPDLFAMSAASVFIFVLWQIPAFHSLLQSNFICSRHNLKAGRVHVLLTYAVSHFSFFHLLFNLWTLNNLAPQVKSAFPSFPLWPLMLGSGLTASTGNALLASRDGCLGLSGVTLGLFAVLARLYPQRILTIRLMGIVPISIASQMLLRILLVWSVLGSFMPRSDVAHVSHLGGILFGLAYCEVRLLKRRTAFWAGFRGKRSPWE